MPNIASDDSTMQHYAFSFAWESPYGHVVHLIDRLKLERGLIVDLGCGNSAVAEPLLELGYEYVGVDLDNQALKAIAKRGLEAHQLDLLETAGLPAQMLKVVNGRKVAAVLLLDVVEHMPDTSGFLTALRAGLDELGRPALVVSVPNVAHVDLGAKLIFGQWQYTSTGLLDRTHLQFFTAQRLQHEMGLHGLLEIGADDFRQATSDQHFPSAHPALSPGAPIGQIIRRWRSHADEHGNTVQFVRAFAPCAAAFAQEDPSDTTPTDERFLTVIMRTQGRRIDNLREALTCLAAQTMDDFDVLLVVHSDTPIQTMPPINELVNEFDPTFASRISILHTAGGGRARPLNTALLRARSEYVAFLDDDDLVMAHWVESFASEARDCAIIRCVGAVRHIAAPVGSQAVPYLVCSNLEFRYSDKFDVVYHFWGNQTPICTFAVPRRLIDFGICFDEDLPVLEDWDFLLKCITLGPIYDTGQVTSVYQMWRTGESSASLHDRALWHATQRLIQERSDQEPLLLPAGSASNLIALCEERAELHAEIDRTVGDLAIVRAELDEVRRAYLTTIGSRRWRILGGPARIVTAVRTALGRQRRPAR